MISGRQTQVGCAVVEGPDTFCCNSIPGNMTMQAIELQLRAFMMKLISLDGALYDIEQPEGE